MAIQESLARVKAEENPLSIDWQLQQEILTWLATILS